MDHGSKKVVCLSNNTFQWYTPISTKDALVSLQQKLPKLNNYVFRPVVCRFSIFKFMYINVYPLHEKAKIYNIHIH